MKPGERVIAISHADKDCAYVFGAGVYEGDFVPVEAAGFMAEAMVYHKITNPRILLDTGKVVYGCECWWGAENQVREALKNSKKYPKVVEVDIDKVRAEIKESLKSS